MTAGPGIVKAGNSNIDLPPAARGDRCEIRFASAPGYTKRILGVVCRDDVTRATRGPLRLPRPLPRKGRFHEPGGNLRARSVRSRCFVIVFGRRQLLTSLKIVDPFFFGHQAASRRRSWTG